MRKIISLTLGMALTLSNFVLPTVNAFADTEDSSAVITGTYQFSSNEGSNRQSQNTFEYRDDCFTRSSFIGCKHLEVLSIQAASASVSWYGTEIDEDEIDTSENAHNIVSLLQDIGFDDVATNTYYTVEKHENSMAVAVGHKTIIQDGNNYTLLAIIPRSAGYKEEWAGNLITGDGDIHEGFKAARDEILRFVKHYISENQIEGRLKVWTAGYSRGAAVADMLAGFFAGGGIEYFGDKVSITPWDIYSYTIGTPRTIKDGIGKNIELSVAGNRTEPDYADDTVGEAYEYTKGGTLSLDDSIYSGLRNLISASDAFPLLPPEEWGFAHYGKTVDPMEKLVSEEEMLNELNSISPYCYSIYTDEDGNINPFKRKTFDIPTLSIVDGVGITTPAEFIRDRMEGLLAIVPTNEVYKNGHYQDALKSLAGTYGMAVTFFREDFDADSLNTSDAIEAGIYTYLSYISEQLLKEGKASNETEAVTIAMGEVLEYIFDTEINVNTLTIDEFATILAEYITEHEDDEIGKTIIKAIAENIPDDKKFLVSTMIGGFHKDFTIAGSVPLEELLRTYIKACNEGADPECAQAPYYDTPEKVRTTLYSMIYLITYGDMPELQPLLMNPLTWQFTGSGLFKDLLTLIKGKFMIQKDEDGKVIKEYENFGEIADEKITLFLDSLLLDAIEKSGDLYGAEYKNDFNKQFTTLKENVTVARRILASILFYSKNGASIAEAVETVTTFAGNAMQIPLAHFEEIYLAKSRTSNRYEGHNAVKRHMKGSSQKSEINNDDKQSDISHKEPIWEKADDWAEEEMEKADEIGLIPETFAKKDFTKKIDRTDFVAVAVKLYEAISGKKAETLPSNPFADTDNEYVSKAYALGITKGTSETTFSPDAEITREEMSAMLTRALEKAGIDITIDTETTDKFDDDTDIHDWGRTSIYFMSSKEIIKGIGDNKMNPLGNAKIEEAIAIALRCIEVFKK